MTFDSSSKINIVLLTDCLGDISGGAEKQIFELAKRLPKDQYNVFVASLEAQGETSRSLIESIGCQLKTFQVIRIYGLSGFLQGIQFFYFLRKNSIHAVVTYHFGSDIWGTFWGHLAGVPFIASNRRDMGFWRNCSHVMTYKLINTWVNKIITVTSSIKQMVMDTESVPAEKIEVIFNGVEFSSNNIKTPITKSELGLLPEDTVIMHVANLRPVKGHRYLIEAFAEVIKNCPTAKLILIGKDELNGELQKLSQKLEINSQILFLGARSDIAQLLPLADICVLTSLSEGMSNAILEYMTFGKPVIATNVGGNPELIRNGYNGLLVSKENSFELSSALIELINDKAKRQVMGNNSLLFVKENFSMEIMLQKYTQLFQIKTLHLISSGGFFGAEQVILTLAACNKNSGQIIGAINNQYNSHLEIIDESKKKELNTIIFEAQGRFNFSTVREVLNFVKKNQIKIIHTHNYKANFIGFWVTLLSPIKWVSTIHGWANIDTKLRWYEFLDGIILRFTNKLICVSQSNYNALLHKRYAKERLAVISNGINLNDYFKTNPDAYLKESLGIQSNDLVIAIVGRLSPEKGHSILIKAFNKIAMSYPNMKCLIIGDGPLRNDIEKHINDLKLNSRIIFTGIRKDMPPIYNICNILINSSYTEGLPLTILEAMACSVAVIATDVGAVSQVIEDQINGLLIKPGDWNLLAEKISFLLDDPSKRLQLAQEGEKKVRNSYSAEAMYSQYQKIYREIVYK